MNTALGSRDFKIGVALLSAMGGIIALVTYLEGREYRRMQKEIAVMDIQLKKLQLQQKS